MGEEYREDGNSTESMLIELEKVYRNSEWETGKLTALYFEYGIRKARLEQKRNMIEILEKFIK